MFILQAVVTETLFQNAGLFALRCGPFWYQDVVLTWACLAFQSSLYSYLSVGRGREKTDWLVRGRMRLKWCKRLDTKSTFGSFSDLSVTSFAFSSIFRSYWVRSQRPSKHKLNTVVSKCLHFFHSFCNRWPYERKCLIADQAVTHLHFKNASPSHYANDIR